MTQEKVLTQEKWISTNDIVSGDTIRYEEAVFGGSWRNPKFMGKRFVTAFVERESYGAARQQHTFTITVIDCDGTDPIKVGTTTRRKGRNLYKNKPMRKLWQDEVSRQSVADEKHKRGNINRILRNQRKKEEQIYGKV